MKLRQKTTAWIQIHGHSTAFAADVGSARASSCWTRYKANEPTSPPSSTKLMPPAADSALSTLSGATSEATTCSTHGPILSLVRLLEPQSQAHLHSASVAAANTRAPEDLGHRCAPGEQSRRHKLVQSSQAKTSRYHPFHAATSP